MTTTKPSAKLRDILVDQELSFLMEAHSAISAMVVQEAGFKGIWASGLSISASLGLRDSNEASWTQVLDIVEYMADAVDVPILLDGDTGYGDFNNARRLTKKLCQRGIAGVCLEDKLFPKTNSFIETAQPLTPIEEFTGKIKACKDSQLDEEFCVVARVEALIAGYGMEETLRRANVYCDSGADAVLVHSKKLTACEIREFMRHWNRDCPIIVVPTTYAQTPTQDFQNWGVSTVIWANHNFRASLHAMQATCNAIHDRSSVSVVEGSLASVDEVFRITNDDELRRAQAKYAWVACDV
ncbi:phosphoenolpyruvate mutase [Thalassococcus sp. S3]|uniref:phosphoenolpyruvate mutase n=1 Tax=Thalassococcus sp. S3 TaxID=2017482 RepID=UPI001C2BA226|nr:phosphoenolpyruvate mutase [Thalassococcus sp. S3]